MGLTQYEKKLMKYIIIRKMHRTLFLHTFKNAILLIVQYNRFNVAPLV